MTCDECMMELTGARVEMEVGQHWLFYHDHCYEQARAAWQRAGIEPKWTRLTMVPA